MIAYVKGKVLAATSNGVILENNGLGYEIICSASAYDTLSVGEVGEVYTYMAVREDDVSLYGFSSLAEKNMFLKLISVSGVGPKMGIAVLSGMNLNDLALAIASSDVKTLSKIKGLGKKTAERIILELRESLSEMPVSVSEPSAPSSVKLSDDAENAVLALVGLGYTKAEATKAVKTSVDKGVNGLENLITDALRNFA
ncbi:MAG: Holliday junction branch migration protein RuvA [Clostridia bacterium]|nr:Holliday junction branch migration protein RuvA [Clostridia bacterium]